LLAPINHEPTRIAVTAERAFLAGLGGGCATPVAALGVVEGDRLDLRARVTRPDGHDQEDVAGQARATPDEARALGERLAADVLRRGAAWLTEALA
ncbi:MAG TPA: hypothetical protein VGR57_19370, partial [Ktedonobacterales bacterium]|nr:hypothetical protein [Ktedonobacterales bacterium]